MIRGTALLGVGNKVQRAAAGEVVVFEPGQDHVLLDASNDLQLFTLALTPELWERRQGQERGSLASTEPLSERERSGAIEALSAMAELHDAVGVETRLSDLFVRLRPLASLPSSVGRRAAQSALAQPTAPCAVLASSLGTHSSHLSRVVARELGVPLVELRARHKLAEFVRLVDGGHAFTRAALDAGFGSYAQCHRVFRRLTGCHPRAYFSGGRARIDAAVSEAPIAVGVF